MKVGGSRHKLADPHPSLLPGGRRDRTQSCALVLFYSSALASPLRERPRALVAGEGLRRSMREGQCCSSKSEARRLRSCAVLSVHSAPILILVLIFIFIEVLVLFEHVVFVGFLCFVLLDGARLACSPAARLG